MEFMCHSTSLAAKTADPIKTLLRRWTQSGIEAMLSVYANKQSQQGAVLYM